MPIQPIWPIFEVNGLDWQCCLAGISKTAPRILIFLIDMGADYSIKVKNIEIWVPAFFKHNNSSVATVRIFETITIIEPKLCLYFMWFGKKAGIEFRLGRKCTKLNSVHNSALNKCTVARRLDPHATAITSYYSLAPNSRLHCLLKLETKWGKRDFHIIACMPAPTL